MLNVGIKNSSAISPAVRISQRPPLPWTVRCSQPRRGRELDCCASIEAKALSVSLPGCGMSAGMMLAYTVSLTSHDCEAFATPAFRCACVKKKRSPKRARFPATSSYWRQLSPGLEQAAKIGDKSGVDSLFRLLGCCVRFRIAQPVAAPPDRLNVVVAASRFAELLA